MPDAAREPVTMAILPVKRLDLAKQRLGAALTPAQRRLLAEAMVSDVLAALAAVSRLARTLVVTREPRITGLATQAGAEVVPDAAEAGQSAAATQGIGRAVELGAGRILLVPGDCPALDPLELEGLLSRAASPGNASVTVVPDRHGTGTNALLIAPPDALAPSFGPGSFERHRRDALRTGVTLEVARPASLLLDIDTAEDLAALRDRLGGAQGLAGFTRRALERL